MKQLFTFLFAAIALIAFKTAPQQGTDEVVAALKAGNATQVAAFFDNTVEIALPSKSSSYSKSQAEMVLKDFLGNNTVKGFQVMHKGDKGGSQFCIGTLSTKNGNYRTTIFMKQKGDKQVLQELRFEN